MKTKALFVLALAIILASETYAQTDIMQGCVGKYLFSGNYNDYSSYKNYPVSIELGTQPDIFTADRNGVENAALHFSGKEWISIERLFTGSFTICFWMRTSQTGATPENKKFYDATGIIDNESIGNGNDFGINLIGKQIIFGIGDEYATRSYKSTISDNKWTYVAAVRDSSTGKMSLYINSVLMDWYDTPQFIAVDAEKYIYFGKLHNSDEDVIPYYEGDLDDIYIFNRALTKEEIIAIKDTVEVSAPNIESSGNHYIGEKYMGGTVFYLYDNNQHGLIVSSPISRKVKWFNGSDKYTGSMGDGLGSGEMNTAMIVATQANDWLNSDFAAELCANYSVEVDGITYGDWYLPSKYELHLLCIQNNLLDINLESTWYFSSTEVDKSYVWAENPVENKTQQIQKGVEWNVIPIRAF